MLLQSMRRPDLLGALVLVFAATAAQAQEIASNFDQLRVVVKPGDIVTVRASSGGLMRGRVLDLSSAALGLQVDGQRHELSMDAVSAITQGRHANLESGAKWGFGIGAGLALTMAAIASARGRCDCLPLFFIGGAIYGGIGAGIGVGIAATTVHEHMIFANPGASAKLNVQPIVRGGRKGLMLTARW